MSDVTTESQSPATPAIPIRAHGTPVTPMKDLLAQQIAGAPKTSPGTGLPIYQAPVTSGSVGSSSHPRATPHSAPATLSAPSPVAPAITVSPQDTEQANLVEYALYTPFDCDLDVALPTHDTDDPLTVSEALARPDAEQWQAAITKELDTLASLGVFEVALCPPGVKPVKCKWVLKKKLKADGSLDKYKGRLVARGFSQTQGVDYFETYAPTVQMSATRALLALNATNDWDIHQIDINSAYVNADLQEKVYMEMPEGFETIVETLSTKQPLLANLIDEARAKRAALVVLLKKALYGLKQSARVWNKCIVDFMLKLGFKQLVTEPSVFIRGHGTDFIAVCMHVDDQNIISPNLQVMSEFKAALNREFGIIDEGETKNFLVLYVIRDREAKTLKLSQSQFAEIILKRYGMENSFRVSTSLDADLSSLHKG
eukprot:TRINITY_DN12662_c0_g2_i2.p1 TRINITY_DN12662_c0_g2~~TRINITY_DN12662_c0_g2_i2.p1  ORF type:complete len:428 (+),score=22.82 TRINITY_DN12662_c0_g2_i2:1103-2386(+)